MDLVLLDLFSVSLFLSSIYVSLCAVVNKVFGQPNSLIIFSLAFKKFTLIFSPYIDFSFSRTGV
jgi:hypothetical protein